MSSRPLLLVSVGFASLALATCGQKPAPAESVTANPVSEASQAIRVVTVDKRNVTDAVEGTGRLVVREEAAVAAEIPGFPVAAVMVDEGDWVKAGQPMARLDDTLLQAQIVQAEAQLAQQKASADFKDSQLRRAESLAEAGAMSKEMIEQRRTEAASAAAALLAAEASVKEMKTRQARMVLRAPVAGRVLQRSIRPGEISGGGQPYFRIARDGLVEVAAELPDSRLSQIKIGQTVKVSLSTGETFDGKVRFISPRVDQVTGLGGARIELPYSEALRPGSFARVDFTGTAVDSLTVVASAVRYESGETLLMVVGDDNRVKGVPVKLGARMGDYVEVLEGVAPGARVLEKGAAFTLDGDTVTPIDADAAK
jgi:HlyD family secretion protein